MYVGGGGPGEFVLMGVVNGGGRTVVGKVFACEGGGGNRGLGLLYGPPP